MHMSKPIQIFAESFSSPCTFDSKFKTCLQIKMADFSCNKVSKFEFWLELRSTPLCFVSVSHCLRPLKFLPSKVVRNWVLKSRALFDRRRVRDHSPETKDTPEQGDEQNNRGPCFMFGNVRSDARC